MERKFTVEEIEQAGKKACEKLGEGFSKHGDKNVLVSFVFNMQNQMVLLEILKMLAEPQEEI